MGKYSKRDQMPYGGRFRFACECGQKLTDGLVAIQHTMAGHETVLETWVGGKWVFRGGSVADYMIEQARKKGENIDEFVTRMEQLAEGMEDTARKAQAVWQAERVLKSAE